MKRPIVSLTIILLLFTLISCDQAPESALESDAENQGDIKTMPNLAGKKILMIIAHENYQDIEYGTPKKIFEETGAQVVTASSESSPASGRLGGTAAVDVVLSEVKVAGYEAVIFVGGPGAVGYVGDSQALRIATEAISQAKVLGAICIAPTILAKAGVLQGKKATVWHASLADDSIKQLRDGGAEFIEEHVVRDGNIVTADGPGAAQKFGEAIVSALGE